VSRRRHGVGDSLLDDPRLNQTFRYLEQEEVPGELRE
jgi:hypothetical protein